MPHLASRVSSGGRLNLANVVKGENGHSPALSEEWIEERFDLATPRYPTQRIDQAWKIEKPGAKAIQVHVREAILDRPYDVAMIFDRFFQEIFDIPTFVSNRWLPAVMGDHLYLKFSNAVVTVQELDEVLMVRDSGEIDPSKISSCVDDRATGLKKCFVYSERSEPFANFNSSGVVIDRIRYIPGQNLGE
jgi:hypothetical protein